MLRAWKLLGRWLTPWVLLGLAACSSTGEKFSAGVSASSLTLMTGQINQLPTRFVVDSGSPSTLLATEKMEHFGVRLGPVTGMSGGIGGLVPRHAALVESWNFAHRGGGPTFIQVQAMPFADERGGPDGLLGLDLLEPLGVVVDYSARRGFGELLVVQDGGKAIAAEARRRGWKTVLLQRTGHDRYQLMTVKIAGQQQLWLVDTGAQRGVIQQSNAVVLGLPMEDTRNRIIGATGHMARSQQAGAVPLTFPNGATVRADLVVLTKDVLGAEAPQAIRYGIVGADVLNALGAIYDIGNAVVYLPPAAPGQEPTRAR